jgi:hypothetical protein
MAFDDVPLEDAGRDYYARQFGHRVRNIRKFGNPPSRKANASGSGWKAVAGVVGAFVVIRIVIGVIVALSERGPSDFDPYQPQAPASPASINWNDDRMGEPQPWQMQRQDDADLPPELPLFRPNEPANLDPGPPVAPPDDPPPPVKDE